MNKITKEIYELLVETNLTNEFKMNMNGYDYIKPDVEIEYWVSDISFIQPEYQHLAVPSIEQNINDLIDFLRETKGIQISVVSNIVSKSKFSDYYFTIITLDGKYDYTSDFRMGYDTYYSALQEGVKYVLNRKKKYNL